MLYKPFFRDDLGYKPRYTQPLYLEEVVVSPDLPESIDGIDLDYQNSDYDSTDLSIGYIPIYRHDPRRDEIRITSKDTDDTSELTYTSSPGKDEFDKSYISIVGEKDKLYKFLSRVAKHESGYNPKAKNPNAPAYGYFQFMEDGLRYRNITNFSGSDIKTFLNTPELQIDAARKLASSFMNQISDKDRDKMKELGLTDSGALGIM